MLPLLATLLLAADLRVMSFNVRYPNPNDGPNRWETRRDLLVETIRTYSPDLMGTQELFHEQGDYIVQQLPDYAWFGLSRRGNQQDEHMGVFYRKDTLKLIQSGNFWLSETPETPGSMSWNVSLPRMVTWGLFELKKEKRRFYYYNTHFAHRREDNDARLRSARLIVERASKLPAQIPFLLTGDFNAPADGDVHRVFAEKWKDVREASSFRFGPEGTFNGFTGASNGPRIDWIFTRGGLRPLQTHAVTLNLDGRYPSDHFAVFTVLRFE